MSISEPARKLRQGALKAVEKSDWRKALECYEGLELVEKNEGGWPQKAAEMCNRLGRAKDAASGYARAVAVYARGGFLLKAIAVCKLILDLDPAHTETQQRLAELHASRLAPPSRLGAPVPVRPARPLHEESLGRLVPDARPAAGLPPGPSESAMEIPLDDDAPEALIRGAFPKTPFFSALGERHLRMLIDEVRLVPLGAGEVLFRAGARGDALYVVASGEVSVRVDDVQVARLGEGAFFGEIALLVDQPRNATTVAIVPSQVLAVDRALINALVQDSPELLRVLLRFVRDRLVGTLLETHPLFGPFGAEERRALAGRFRFVEAPSGLRLLEEGKPSVGLFLTLAGRATVYRGGSLLATLAPGDLFGEMSLLSRGPATADVITERKSFLLLLRRADFEEVIMTHPHVLEYVNAVASGRQMQTEHVLVI